MRLSLNITLFNIFLLAWSVFVLTNTQFDLGNVLGVEVNVEGDKSSTLLRYHADEAIDLLFMKEKFAAARCILVGLL